MLKFACVFGLIAILWSPTLANPAVDANPYPIARYRLINEPTGPSGGTIRRPNEVGRQFMDSLWNILEQTGPFLDAVWTTPGPSVTTRKPTSGFTQCELQCHKFVTPEYDPQCGSDGLTYTNTGKVECAKRCGKVLKLRRGACEPNNTQLL